MVTSNSLKMVKKIKALSAHGIKSSAFEINHLLIKPDGEIYIYYGLTNILDVLDWSVD